MEEVSALANYLRSFGSGIGPSPETLRNPMQFVWRHIHLEAIIRSVSIAKVPMMTHDNTVTPTSGDREAVLLQLVAKLQNQLGEIDEMGIHLAAAHVDAAITRLRCAALQQRRD